MRIALTIGDPNGIGPEVVLRAAHAMQGEVDLVVVGRRDVLDWYGRQFGLEDVTDSLELVESGAEVDFSLDPGELSATAGEVAMLAVERACDLCLDGTVDAMVTAPISKNAINLAGYDFPGHTEYLAERSGAADFVMLMASDRLRVALVTIHIPVREVAEHVTAATILKTLIRLDHGLRLDFGIDRPRIAMLGLNPHAGDGGVIGSEEIEVIAPALQEARERGIDVSGPHVADGFFGRRGYEEHDAVLACYHDQGLAPFKALSMGAGVNVTLGLPIVRTSPDHGTAFEIAGTGRADASSLVAAIRLASEIAHRRKSAISCR